MVFNSGNKGESIRSDCWVSITTNTVKRNVIEVESKVNALYGESIYELCQQILSYYKIHDAHLTLIDKGALPFVIAARIEAAITQYLKIKKPYLLGTSISCVPTKKDLHRSSRLYIPGNTPKLMINAGIYGSAGIILDLEDSVHPEKKVEARILVRNALRSIDFKGSERMVRINQLPTGYDDMDIILEERPNLILIPKCESAETVELVDKYISNKVSFNSFPIYLMPIIESAMGVQNAYEIASASKRNVAMAIGLEDYTADIGVERSESGKESLFARMTIVNASNAVGIQAIDSVFSDVSDLEALGTTVESSKALGFVGMGCIHPRQVSVINRGYAPTNIEIEKAKKIVHAFEKASQEGVGVVSLGSKMIDAPVVERAKKIIARAEIKGLIDKTWRANYAG